MARTKRQKTSRTRSAAASKPAARRGGGGRAAEKKNNEATLKSEVDALVDKLLKARRPVSLRDARRQFERSYVEYIIRKVEGDRPKAAERLDIGFSTLKEKIRKPKGR